MQILIGRSATLFLLSLLAGCGNSSSPADEPTIGGRYSATVFTTILGTDTADVLAQGGFLRFTLNPDTSLAGVVRLPESDSLVLGGAWVSEDSVVAFKTVPATLLEEFRFHQHGQHFSVDTVLDKRQYLITFTHR